MKFQKLLSLVGCVAIISLAVGCSAVNSPIVITATPAPQTDPGSSATGPVTGTSVSSTGPSLSGGSTNLAVTSSPLVTPTPLMLDASGNLSVSLADNNGTVLMQVGQRFLLNLGDTYTWGLSIDDQSIISRVPNILTIRGSQGLFEAHKAGVTVLHASGDPQCRQSTPPCGMPSIIFQIQVTVQ